MFQQQKQLQIINNTQHCGLTGRSKSNVGFKETANENNTYNRSYLFSLE
jgi:hypothetical protein